MKLLRALACTAVIALSFQNSTHALWPFSGSQEPIDFGAAFENNKKEYGERLYDLYANNKNNPTPEKLKTFFDTLCTGNPALPSDQQTAIKYEQQLKLYAEASFAAQRNGDTRGRKVLDCQTWTTGETIGYYGVKYGCTALNLLNLIVLVGSFLYLSQFSDEEMIKYMKEMRNNMNKIPMNNMFKLMDDMMNNMSPEGTEKKDLNADKIPIETLKPENLD
jgi:hypothetical protein